MSRAVPVRVAQGTDAWLAYRRTAVTGTDIPVILGVSPWRCEADLADDKRGLSEPQPESVAMRRGRALEPLVADLYAEATGRAVRRSRAMWRHPRIEWAAASLDFTVVGERRIVEAKTTSSRARFADGVPDDVRAQVAWQLGVMGWPVADVAVLEGDRLSVHEVAADEALFSDMVAIAEDFRRRLDAGGPFARDLARVRRDHPSDDGSEMAADADLDAAASALLDVRASIRRHQETEERLVRAITDRMGDAAVLTGTGWRATWRRTRDRTETDWASVAGELLAATPEPERSDAVARHTITRPGTRPFRLAGED